MHFEKPIIFKIVIFLTAYAALYKFIQNSTTLLKWRLILHTDILSHVRKERTETHRAAYSVPR